MAQKPEIIQALRGIAALSVVAYHFREYLKKVSQNVSEQLQYGYLGVDIFFVISGFIIYVSTQKNTSRNAYSFLVRRFFRVVPPAWVAMVLMAIAKPPYLSGLLYGMFFLPRANATPPFYGYNFLIVTWTLTYELIFYMIFSFVLCFRVGQKFRGLITCILIISLLGNPIMLEFGVGIFFGWLYVTDSFNLSLKALFGLLLISLAILTYLAMHNYGSGHGMTHGGMLALFVIFICLILQELLFKLSKPQSIIYIFYMPMSAVGEISYSLYLTHPIVKSVFQRLGWNETTDEANTQLTIFCLAMVCCFALAVCFYRWVELPTWRMGRSLAYRE